MTADAMASTVSVLGPEPGLKLVGAAKNVETLIVTIERSQIVLRESKKFPGKNRL